MKLFKRILPLLLALLLLPMGASAAGYVDLDRTASVTITAQYEGMPMEGMILELHRVSDMDETGELTVREPFASFASDLDIRGRNDAAWQETAEKLERWVILDQMEPMSEAKVNEEGIASLSGLPMGLYLVVTEGLEKDGQIYTVAPFFLVVPERDSQDRWNYDVCAKAKPAENPKRMDYRVIKLWKDTCHPEKRPESITVRLYCDGEPYGEPVTLPENGRWSHTWKDLDVNHKWTVVEERVPGYRSEVATDGTTFLITNTHTHTTTPDKPGKLPQTGQLWWPVPLLLWAGVLCLVIGLIRRRGSRYENER